MPRVGQAQTAEISLQSYEANTRPGPDYEDGSAAPAPPNPPPVRLIAYYLPQFHATSENDEWWGKGFTEWTNVTKALPRYQGHYQPRLPADLGFYDLSVPDTMARQAELAKRYGIGGFCFHHYWFDGRQLLDTPLKLLLANPQIDMPFCLNWANEDWTRRWEGQAHKVLIAQKHSPEDDIAFAKSIEPALRDPRYIRVDGRPLLMLYHPSLLPDAKATVDRWRSYFLSVGVGDPFVIMPQAFGASDPRAFGMDAAAGFPPHASGFDIMGPARHVKPLGAGFTGLVGDYEEMAKVALANRPGEFRLFPGVCPGWDNEPRRTNNGVSFINANPRNYGDWLAGACEFALQAERPDERIVFINAWNEWAEGAYLEPDRHYGHAFLAETARVLNDLADPGKLALRRERLASAFARPRARRGLVQRVAVKAALSAETFARALRAL